MNNPVAPHTGCVARAVTGGVLHYTEAWPNATPTRTITLNQMDVLGWMAGWLSDVPAGTPFVCDSDAFRLQCTRHTQPTPDRWGARWLYAPDPTLRLRDRLFGSLERVPGEWGWSNMDYYITQWLRSNNGSRAALHITRDTLLWTALDDTQPVLRYTHGNECALDDTAARTVCGLGSGEATCAFLTGDAHGFSCAKFGSSGSALLDRATRGTMAARRIGGCRVSGRTNGGCNAARVGVRATVVTEADCNAPPT